MAPFGLLPSAGSGFDFRLPLIRFAGAGRRAMGHKWNCRRGDERRKERRPTWGRVPHQVAVRASAPAFAARQLRSGAGGRV